MDQTSFGRLSPEKHSDARRFQGLVAINTMLGWMLQGPSQKNDYFLDQNHSLVCVLRADVQEKMSDTLRSFRELKSLGISDYGSENEGKKI